MIITYFRIHIDFSMLQFYNYFNFVIMQLKKNNNIRECIVILNILSMVTPPIHRHTNFVSKTNIEKLVALSRIVWPCDEREW